nr:MAG TPA: hypothetical protein [Caudoviricetes sp.]
MPFFHRWLPGSIGLLFTLQSSEFFLTLQNNTTKQLGV